MDPRYVELFALNRFSSGRRLSLYNQLELLARKRKVARLEAHLRRARKHDIRTREYDNRWASPDRRNAYAPEVAEIDNQVDPALTQIRNIAREHIVDLEAEHPLYERVNGMLEEIFPAGVAAITSLPFVDQVAAVEIIVRKLQNEFASVIRELALDRKVERLAALTVQYREAVDRGPAPLEFATVRQSRTRGHAYLLEIVSIIMGTYCDSDNPEHVAARAELLAPILEHNDRVRELHRTRRSSAIDEPGEPPGEPPDEPPDEPPGELADEPPDEPPG